MKKVLISIGFGAAITMAVALALLVVFGILYLVVKMGGEETGLIAAGVTISWILSSLAHYLIELSEDEEVL